MSRAEELKERLQKLWIVATSSCGGAPAQVLEEIRGIERELEALEKPGLNPDHAKH
jgi:hypothetical protein